METMSTLMQLAGTAIGIRKFASLTKLYISKNRLKNASSYSSSSVKGKWLQYTQYDEYKVSLYF